jgi:hypothetical protein
MNDGVSQGVDKQLNILQTLLSFITDFATVHGRLRTNVRAFVLCSVFSFSSLTDGPALLLCFKLHGSRTGRCHPCQFLMFNVDEFLAPIDDSSSTTTRALALPTRDVFAIFEDLCLLGNGERLQFVQLESLHKKLLYYGFWGIVVDS